MTKRYLRRYLLMSTLRSVHACNGCSHWDRLSDHRLEAAVFFLAQMTPQQISRSRFLNCGACCFVNCLSIDLFISA